MDKFCVFEKSDYRGIGERLPTSTLDAVAAKSVELQPIPIEQYRQLSAHEKHLSKPLYIVVNRGYECWFQFWYECCLNDPYFIDVEMAVNYYNKLMLGDMTKTPIGWEERVKYDLKEKERHANYVSSNHWAGVMGLELRRPNMVGYIGIDSGHIGAGLTKEQKLRKKFAFITIINELDLKGLEELDEWYEDLRYKELEEFKVEEI